MRLPLQQIDLWQVQFYIHRDHQPQETIMSGYQHKKGIIRDNAIEALLHDPLFKVRIEANVKGKGSYRRKDKHAKKGNWEASGKDSFTTGLLLLSA